jgi:fumarate reductase flavoprotein subunit
MNEFNQVFVNRRGFLKGMLVASAAVSSGSILAGCGAQSAAGVKWDEEADVLVIGGGGTGLVAAIEAVETGQAKVVVFEKSASIGGSTSISGAVIQAAGTSFQKEFANVNNDTPDIHAELWIKESEGIANPDLVTLMAKNAPGAIDWLVAHGLTYVDVYGVSRIPTVDPALNLKRIHVPGGRGEVAQAGTGEVHIAVLFKVAQDLGVTFQMETPVTALVVDDNKTVVGVKAQVGNQEKFFKANRAVVLAAGSIDHNKEMAREMAAQQLWELETGLCFCAPTNTGDGIKMAMALGADLAGMGGTIGVPFVSMGAAALNAAIPAVPGIWVNKYGQRFVDEASHYAFAMRAVFFQEDSTAWAVFDESTKNLGGAALGGIWGPLSEDLSEELASGRIVKGETLADLAMKIGVNASQLEVSMNKWNEDMDNGGVDTVFGKSEALVPMKEAPYYATKVTSVNLGNVGGVKIDTDARVIDVHGKPISRLYAGGMNAGGFIGPYYPGSGTAICATVVFGRIAGANAAKETA